MLPGSGSLQLDNECTCSSDHKCDWETRMITDKKIIADNNNNYYNYYTEIMLYMCVYVLQLTLQCYQEYIISSIRIAVLKSSRKWCHSRA